MLVVPTHKWQPVLGKAIHKCADCGYEIADRVMTVDPDLIPDCVPGARPHFPNAWNMNGHAFPNAPMVMILECARCRSAFATADIRNSTVPQCSGVYYVPHAQSVVAAAGTYPPVWRSLWDGLDKDTQDEQESKPKPKKKYATCPDCEKEISPVLDAYYGKDEFMKARCQPCRAKRGQRRSA